MKRNDIFDLTKKDDYRTAAANDLIAMVKAKGFNQLFIPKYILEFVCYGIVFKEFIHLSGQTGSAKTSLINTIAKEPENLKRLCGYLDLPFKPVYMYEIEMCIFETPGELIQHKDLKDGNTYFKDSILVTALKDAPFRSEKNYPVIYLKEMGRVHTPCVQGGLLNLLTHSDITLGDQSKIEGGHAAIICDSNYAALEEATHTLVVQDEALKRRTPLNIMLNSLSSSEEQKVIEALAQNEGLKADTALIKKLIRLGGMVRQYRNEGSLLSLSPPTIYGYMAALKMKMRLPHADLGLVLNNTLLGNATKDDRKIVETLLQTVLYDERYFNSRRSTFTDDAI